MEEIAKEVLNHIYQVKQKLEKANFTDINRNIDRLENKMNQLGFYSSVPLFEKFDETRSDCTASIVGEKSDNLIITSVIKPILYQKMENGTNVIIQTGVVVAESKK